VAAGGDVWSRFSSDPRARAAAELRATDADRDLVLEVLAVAYAEGSLDREEYDQRSDVALAVRRLGEVRPLVGDLVALPEVRGAWQDAREEAGALYRREVRDARNGFLFVSALTTVVWGGTAVFIGFYFFWPAIPAAALGLGWLAAIGGQQSRIDALEQEALERRRRRLGGG
jgi:hypothetical protein